LKLFASPMSPYVRKVRAVAVQLGIAERIGQITRGTFDVKAFAAEFNKQREEASAQQKVMDEAMRPIKEAMAAKKFGEAVIAADKAIAKYPIYTMVFAIFLFARRHTAIFNN